MVEPEIHHHFFKLSRTFHGSQEACLSGLFHDYTCPLPGALSGLFVTLLRGSRGWPILGVQFRCAKAQRRKTIEFGGLTLRKRYRFGAELLFDIFFRSDRFQTLDVPWSRAES